MPVFSVSISAQLENIESLTVNHDEFNYFLRIECNSCHTEADSPVAVCRSDQVESGRSTVNLAFRCKFCKRDASISIVENSQKAYTDQDNGQFKELVKLDCRGLVPIAYEPQSSPFIAIASESGTKFHDVDLSEESWSEWDESGNQPVSIMEFQSKIEKA